mgnify:CR=1 FL=1
MYTETSNMTAHAAGTALTVPRYLSKSRFKLACECPTKLYYSGKPSIYPDTKLDDSFLQSLADGGFQVGELAKHYFPGGIEIERAGYEAAAEKTRQLIEAGDATIYEAAFLAENFFIYADIVERRGDILYLYEVKAKSIDPAKDEFLTKNRKGILATWQPYLLDVAFQKMVMQKAFPQFSVEAHLMLIDKTQVCSADGLHQKFRVKRGANGRMIVISHEPTEEQMRSKLLRAVNVDEICDGIYSGTLYTGPMGTTFETTAKIFADSYAADEKIVAEVTKDCSKCEFRATPEQLAAGQKDGFRECWSNRFGWNDSSFDRANVLDIWNFRGKDKLIEAGRVTVDTLAESDFKIEPSDRTGLSTGQRQWLQVQKAQSGDTAYFLDRDGLAAEMRQWQFPLHFIDFETATPAIPFFKGMRSYQTLAFQYSHHVVYEDGRVEHRGQYLHTTSGEFPSYDLVRSLKAELEQDNGSIFRYANHENVVLNHISEQLAASGESDREELLAFIKTITVSTNRSDEQWKGERSMIDMLDLVKRFYYDPKTGGSNSIKYVLPAILNSSAYLQDKYSRAIYGTGAEIGSFNFKEKAWVVRAADGSVADPYKSLPKMFADISEKDLEALLSDNDEMKDGGAAMTAYAKLQYQEMSDYERSEIEAALLKYCELDTLAMVMIYEAWREMM